MICGKRATGSSRKATRTSKRNDDREHRRENRTVDEEIAHDFGGAAAGCRWPSRGQRAGELHGRAGFKFLRAIHHHHVAGRETFLDHPVAALLLAHFDIALLGRAGVVHDPDVILVLQTCTARCGRSSAFGRSRGRDHHSDVLPGVKKLFSGSAP